MNRVRITKTLIRFTSRSNLAVISIIAPAMVRKADPIVPLLSNELVPVTRNNTMISSSTGVQKPSRYLLLSLGGTKYTPIASLSDNRSHGAHHTRGTIKTDGVIRLAHAVLSELIGNAAAADEASYTFHHMTGHKEG